ncbi:hypothetical protein [Facilibium subflavum]|uniref:hypothetical protein n=1 Tax=Facilibium subflavum TaxID=2219058 RepID=UPI000E655632|nr:hypothetical protein [Facilibium subflavum]
MRLDLQKQLERLRIQLRLIKVFAYLDRRYHQKLDDMLKEAYALKQALYTYMLEKKMTDEEKLLAMDEKIIQQIHQRYEVLSLQFEQFMEKFAHLSPAEQSALNNFAEHKMDEEASLSTETAFICDHEMSDDEVNAYVKQKINQAKQQKTQDVSEQNKDNANEKDLVIQEQINIKSAAHIPHVCKNINKLAACYTHHGAKSKYTLICKTSMLLNEMQKMLDQHLEKPHVNGVINLCYKPELNDSIYQQQQRKHEQKNITDLQKDNTRDFNL